MNRRLSIPIFAFCLTYLCIAAEPASANVRGSDTHNFYPLAMDKEFITVHSSSTLDPGIFQLMGFLDYAGNSLTNFRGVESQGFTDVSDTLLTGTFGLGVGLSKNWSAAATVTGALSHTSDNAAFGALFTKTGLTDIGIHTKYRIYNKDDLGMALVGGIIFHQTENDPFTGVDPSPSFNIEFALDKRFGQNLATANIGYRVRSPGARLTSFQIAPFDDQFIWSLGFTHAFRDSAFRIIGEIYGDIPVNSDNNFGLANQQASNEILIGTRYAASERLDISGGFSFRTFSGTSSPSWRVFLGALWRFGPYWGSEKKSVEPEPEPYLEPEEPIAQIAPEPPSIEELDTVQPSQQLRLENLNFAIDSAAVTPEMSAVIADIVQQIRDMARSGQDKRPIEAVVIEGHTDSTGTPEYNQDLSQRRAESIRLELLSQLKIKSSSKVRAVGYGLERPIADNGTPEGRSENRRVEIKIYRQGDI